MKEQSMKSILSLAVVLLIAMMPCSLQAQKAVPGTRTLVDAHNCYPYNGRWSDRIDRALLVGAPLAIEQDLAWHTDTATHRSWSVVTHDAPTDGSEPVMEHYFFDKVRPIVEKALRDGDRSQWPLITLNLDFKDSDADHIAAVLALLRKYSPWLTSSVKTASIYDVHPLEVKPILVLTGEDDAQQTVFYDQLHPGDSLLVFGAIHTEDKAPTAAPAVIGAEKATNYRRWWNNPWKVVEPEGQPAADSWTPEKVARLRSLVEQAHAKGLWIRFYTLDGASEAELSSRGWFQGYNFGSLEQARVRWRAAIAAHVDYLASDQYELLGAEVRKASVPSLK
jgi:hypothetical protein